MSEELTISDFVEMGHGVRGALLRTDDGVIRGFEYEHPRPDGGAGWREGLCAGYAPVNSAFEPQWELVSAEPLTLSPSLLCRACGHHGWVRDGQWVPA